MTLERTPWVDRTWSKTWDRVSGAVPSSHLPQIETEGSSKKKPPQVVEYGCGHYGCVMPTHEPNLVVKMTTDPSEAAFAAWSLSVQRPESGIVRYSRVVKLSLEQFRRRPLFLLWREEAFHVGFLFKQADRANDEYLRRSSKEGVRLLTRLRDQANEIRTTYLRWSKAGTLTANIDALWKAYDYDAPGRVGEPERMAAKLHECRMVIDEISNSYLVDTVGHALGHYLELGVLLADVHANNVGKDKEGSSVIVDPGHAVVVNPSVAIPKIEEL